MQQIVNQGKLLPDEVVVKVWNGLNTILWQPGTHSSRCMASFFIADSNLLAVARCKQAAASVVTGASPGRQRAGAVAAAVRDAITNSSRSGSRGYTDERGSSSHRSRSVAMATQQEQQ